MSTRATYLIMDIVNETRQCFYIHHDGYPSGAASYFIAMLGVWNQMDSKRAEINPFVRPWDSDLTDLFERANPQAKPIENWDDVGDIEWTYEWVRDVDGTNRLRVWSVKFDGDHTVMRYERYNDPDAALTLRSMRMEGGDDAYYWTTDTRIMHNSTHVELTDRYATIAHDLPKDLAMRLGKEYLTA